MNGARGFELEFPGSFDSPNKMYSGGLTLFPPIHPSASALPNGQITRLVRAFKLTQTGFSRRRRISVENNRFTLTRKLVSLGLRLRQSLHGTICQPTRPRHPSQGQ